MSILYRALAKELKRGTTPRPVEAVESAEGKRLTDEISSNQSTSNTKERSGSAHQAAAAME